MKKKILILGLFLMLFIPNTVLAYRIPCTTKNLNKIKNEAYSVKLTYDFVTGEDNKRYFEIYASGLTPNLELKYGSVLVQYNAEAEKQLLVTNDGGNVTLYVDVYEASGTPCGGSQVLTKSITLPKYNVYSEREECIEYEEFRLCNKWSKENIPNDAYFDDELLKYKETLKKDEDTPINPKKESLFTKIINFYKDNIYICAPVTIVLVVGIIFVTARSIIRRKNRIKLDIKR